MGYVDSITEISDEELGFVVGGGIGAAALGAAAAVVGTVVAAGALGYSIGRDIGKAIFGND